MAPGWDYQLDKIRYSLELAIERRPKRATSAQPFLLVAVPQMKEAIAAKDRARFEERFIAFTALCNACHALENVAYLQVVQPTQRLSPIEFTASSRSTAPPLTKRLPKTRSCSGQTSPS